ncbi:j domain-containing protein [Nephila pilipes]|uniref:J domain-containing protein n=1 Tax=Nephila pilipes TaxID=299642 RepID=A0A8X6PJ42_NEPPI|nr:j domain-containing protein [Nephila pilipes]
MPNLYQILSVDSGASAAEIAEAAGKLAEEWNPSNFEERKTRVIVSAVLQEIIDARDILLDSQKRKEYDVRIGLADIVYKSPRPTQHDLERNKSRVEEKTKEQHIEEADTLNLDKDKETTIPPNTVKELKIDLEPSTSKNSKPIIYEATEKNQDSENVEMSDSEKHSEAEKSLIESRNEEARLSSDHQWASKDKNSPENPQTYTVTLSKNVSDATVSGSQPNINNQVIPRQIESVRTEDQTGKWSYQSDASFKDEKK